MIPWRFNNRNMTQGDSSVETSESDASGLMTCYYSIQESLEVRVVLG
jgi:hypothetical protein